MIAALRDASWLNSPDTASTKKYHLFREGEALSLCGRAVLADFTAVPAAGCCRARALLAIRLPAGLGAGRRGVGTMMGASGGRTVDEGRNVP